MADGTLQLTTYHTYRTYHFTAILDFSTTGTTQTHRNRGRSFLNPTKNNQNYGKSMIITTTTTATTTIIHNSTTHHHHTEITADGEPPIGISLANSA